MKEGLILSLLWFLIFQWFIRQLIHRRAPRRRSEQEHHFMEPDGVSPWGEEEWFCPKCLRRIAVREDGRHSKKVLQPGDDEAFHWIYRRDEMSSLESDPLHHEMVLEKTHASGAEEWFCPTCGRRFLMSWSPNYSRVVLEPGDESAVHSWRRAHGEAAELPSTKVSRAPSESPPEDSNPERWKWIEQALRESGFGFLLDGR